MDPHSRNGGGGGGYPSAVSSSSSHAARPANPFRDAEKKYQLHFDQEMTFSKGKLRGRKGRFRERPTDLSDVLDVDDDGLDPDGGLRRGVRREVRTLGGAATLAVYTLDDHPGFYFVREFLDAGTASDLAREVVTDYIDPPATSNHTARHGDRVGSLWRAAHLGLHLREEAGADDDDDNGGGRAQWTEDRASASAADLLERLRWVSLGPHFDWTGRVYLRGGRHRPLPDRLRALANDLVSSLGIDRARDGAAFDADAALVNFYASKDTLGGHKDDAEADLTRPLVSLSLGCPAIFLLGGETKETAPAAIMVRHGDVIVLHGEARRSYHGVPRVFSSVKRRTESGESEDDGAGGDKREREDEEAEVEAYLKEHRINVSVRMVR